MSDIIFTKFSFKISRAGQNLSYTFCSIITYGTESQIMNMHSLIHLTDDVTNMKCSLSSLTTFPFENALGKIKNMLRSGNRPLSQICRRLHETFFADEEKITLPPIINNKKVKRILPSGEVSIKKLRYKEAILSCNSPNNSFIEKWFNNANR